MSAVGYRSTDDWYTNYTIVHCTVRHDNWWELLIGTPTVMASSHRKHWQDKTVLSCLVCGVNAFENKQDKTQFTPHFETEQNCCEIFSRWQSWLVFNSVSTVNTDKTRQDSFVLSVFAVWTRHEGQSRASWRLVHRLLWQPPNAEVGTIWQLVQWPLCLSD